MPLLRLVEPLKVDEGLAFVSNFPLDFVYGASFFCNSIKWYVEGLLSRYPLLSYFDESSIVLRSSTSFLLD